MSEAPYPPAEPPADGDRTSQVPPPHGMAPRYSASASVPVPPAGPASYTPASPFGQAAQYGQPAAPFGQDGGPAPAPTSGQARAAASASVPAPATQPNPPPYGNAPQGYPAQSGGTYGSPTPQQYGTPAGQGQFGQPPPGQGSFGAAPTYGQPAPGTPAPSTGTPGYSGGGYDRSGMAAPMGQMGQQPMGQQPMGQQMGQQPMGQGSYGAPGYGQVPADQGRRDAGQPPAGGWAEGEQQEPPPRKSRRGLIVAVIVVVVLVVVGVGGFVGWSLTNHTSDFKVGACVKQNGADAVVTDCGGSGAYKITSIVETENGCPDANQPSLVLVERVGGGKKWACLAPSS